MKRLLSIVLCILTAVFISSCAGNINQTESQISEDVETQAVEESLDAPEIESVSESGDCALEIKWTEVEGAEGYDVYCKTSDSDFDKIESVLDTSYTHEGLEEGETYTYKVRAYTDEDVFSEFSEAKSKKVSVTYTAEDLIDKSVDEILELMGNKYTVKKGEIETFYYFCNYKVFPGMDFYFNKDWDDKRSAKKLVKNREITIGGIEVNGSGLGCRKDGELVRADYDYKKCTEIYGEFDCTASTGGYLGGALGALGYSEDKGSYSVTLDFELNDKLTKKFQSGTEKIPYSTVIKENPKIQNIVIRKANN